MLPNTKSGGLGYRIADPETHSSVEYVSTGVVSFLVSAIWLATFYGWFLSLVQPLHVLSTTALVMLFLLAWATVWLVVELVWEWGHGILSAA